MGKKSQPSAPPPPNPGALIQQQGQQNRVNEITPYGSSIYSQTPEGQWQRNTTLNPASQQTLNNQQWLGQASTNLGNQLFYDRAMNQFNRGPDYSSVPGMVSNVGNVPGVNYGMFGGNGQGGNGQGSGYGNITRSVNNPGAQSAFNGPNPYSAHVDPNAFNIDAYYNRVNSAMAAPIEAEFNRRDPQLETRLHNQGIALGGEAWKNGKDDLERARASALQGASSAAYGQALAASQNAFGQAMGAENLGLGSQQQQYNQALGSAQFGNQGLGQQFGQNIAAGQFGNAAQGQGFNQGLAGYGMFNQAQNQAFNQAMQNAGLQNQAHSQGTADTLQQYYQPYQDIRSLYGMAPMQVPQFGATPQIDVTGPYGLQYQGQLNNYNQQMGNQGAQQAGMFGMLGNVAGAMPWGSWFGG